MAAWSGSRPSLHRDSSSPSIRSVTSRIDSIIDMYIDRPLPPTPGKPSASPLSFMDHLSNGSSASLRSNQSVKTKQPNLFKRASRIPEQLRIKGGNLEKLIHGHQHDRDEEDPKPHSLIDLPHQKWKLEDIHPGERVMTPPAWEEPALQINGESQEGVSSQKEVAKRKSSKRKSKRGVKTASGGYFDQVSPQSPETAAVRLNPDSSYEPSPITPIAPWPETEPLILMESRISNVMDQPTVPEMLECSAEETNGEIEQVGDCRASGAADRRSGTSSVLSGGSSLGELPTVFRSLTKKDYGLRRRPSSKYPTEGGRPDSQYLDDEYEDNFSDDDGIQRSKSIFFKLRSNSIAAAEAGLFEGDDIDLPATEAEESARSPSDERRRGSLSDRLKSVSFRNPPLQVRIGHHPRLGREPPTPKDDRFKAKKLLNGLPMGKEKRIQKQEREERVAELRRKIRYVLPEKTIDDEQLF